MTDKYYTPEIEEFYTGFEYEVQMPKMRSWSNETFYLNKSHIDLVKYVNIQDEHVENKIRVKYLDKADIEECGFTYTDKYTISDKDCYKLLPDKTIYQISPYFSFRHEERENLVRIYKGELHRYPYQEIFRGDVKNKSELKQVLKMLKIS